MISCQGNFILDGFPRKLGCGSKWRHWRVLVPSRNHGGWQFDAAKESEYPPLLCKRIVNLVRECLKDRFDFHVDRASSGHRQTKHSRALIPEYHHITKHPPAAHLSYKELPPLQRGDIFGEEDKLNGVANDESMQFGVYHTPSQFVKLAQMARHPCDHLFSVEDNTRDNLFDFLTKGPNYIAKQRIEFARRVAINQQDVLCTILDEAVPIFCSIGNQFWIIIQPSLLVLSTSLLLKSKKVVLKLLCLTLLNLFRERSLRRIGRKALSLALWFDPLICEMTW